MTIRTRKLIGAILLLILVAVWAFGAVAVAQFALSRADNLVSALYYLIAGLGWVLPAMPLIAWMSRRDAA